MVIWAPCRKITITGAIDKMVEWLYLEIADAIRRSRVLGPTATLALRREDVHDRAGHRSPEDAGLLRLVRVDRDDGAAAHRPRPLLPPVAIRREGGDEGLVFVVVDVEAERVPPGRGHHLRRVAAVDPVAGNEVGICGKGGEWFNYYVYVLHCNCQLAGSGGCKNVSRMKVTTGRVV